jgi:hypothetical protein
VDLDGVDLAVPLQISDLFIATGFRSDGQEEMGGGLTVVVNAGDASGSGG